MIKNRDTIPQNSNERQPEANVNREPTEPPSERSIVLEIITEFIESGELKDALEDIKKKKGN